MPSMRMIRPPPLQLKFDNRFPYPLKTPVLSARKSAAAGSNFFAALYKANWRNIVIALAGLNGLRYAFASYNAMADAATDDLEAEERLLRVSIALCVMYLVSLFVQIYGIFGVTMRRLRLVRIYLHLSFLSCMLIVSTGVLQCVAYFFLAEDVVTECVSLAVAGKGYEKSTYRSHPWPSTIQHMSRKMARSECMNAWAQDAWAQVAAAFVFHVFPAIISYIVVYLYCRQTTQSGHVGCLLGKEGGENVRRRRGGGAYRRVDQTDDSTPMTTGRLESQTQTLQHRRRAEPAPAPAPVMTQVVVQNPVTLAQQPSTRGIKRSHRPPPLVQSPSPLLGSSSNVSFTPGPPAYDTVPRMVGAGAGRSRVYAAFVAPVGSGFNS